MSYNPLLDLATKIVIAHSGKIVLDDDAQSALRFWQNFIVGQDERERAADITQDNGDAARSRGPMNTFDNIYFGREDFGYGADN